MVLITCSFLMTFILEYTFIRLVFKEKSKCSFAWLLYLLMALAFALMTCATASLPMVPYVLLNAFVTTTLSLFLHRYVFTVVDWRILFFLGIFVTLVTLILNSIYQAIVVIFFPRSILPLGISLLGLGMILLIVLGLMALLTKTRIYFVLSRIADHPSLALIIALTVSLLNILIEIIRYTYFSDDYSFALTGLYILSYGAVIGVYVFLLREFLREQRLRESEALILQQQAYLQRLETIQQDLRKIHHDYKNIATGLYAQVESGDIEAAQEFISSKMLQMDKEIRLDLQQLNQLANIEVIELKTLIMAKVMQAEKAKVQLVIEVMEPVKKIPMEMTDLLRCSGILMDNAIEAAAREEQRRVTIILLMERGKLTFIVKNPASQIIDLQRIWTQGYSTKGENRGLGLTNLKEITRRYPDIWLETRVEKQEFIQMLTFKLI